ncbi:MAG TPA: DUF4292 domain-containing protein [Caldithrix abyssi]|uniref:DUF4292 domain-containing protein n=1 Tax=Caldithrix abyssi TaxID=187145 RepID=A0A7V5UFH4_CALAY|nr:DUF4292 domain-containing protein [Caldithrix abyssi]
MKKIAIFILSVLLLSCAVRKQVSPDIQKVSYKQLLRLNEARIARIHSLQAEAKITVDSPEFSGNFSADIYLTGGDSLLLSITGPMGLPMGKVFIAPKRFIFYNQVMNQFMTGTLKQFESLNLFQFPFHVSEIGDVFLAKDAFDILKKNDYRVQDGMYFLDATAGQWSYRIWFDPALLVIKKIEYRSGDQLLFYKTYDQFEEIDGVYFPKSINFVRPEMRQGFSLYYESVRLNRKIDRKYFDIKISDSAKQINLSVNQ